MSSPPDEIPEKEFIERLRRRDAHATRTQLRHLKRKGEIRGAVQRRVSGQPGSVSMYLVSELDRVAALLAVEVHGRKTVERASREAWLQFGESALPPGMTSRAYILNIIDEKRTALEGEPEGAEFLNLMRNPVDIDADEEGTQSEKAFLFIEGLVAEKRRSPEFPLIDLATHAMVIKDYAAEGEPSDVDSVAQLLGAISTPESNREAWGESNFALPVAQMFLNPRGFLADVSDETIELARQTAAPFIESMRAFIDLPERLERLKQPAGADAESLATLGRLFSGPLISDPAVVVAYLAKQLSTGDETAQMFLRRMDTITEGLANAKKLEAMVAADPSILKTLEEFAAVQRKKST